MSENAGHKHVYSPGIGADNPISLSVFFSQYTPFAASFPPLNYSVMHQSFVAPAPSGPRNSGAFNFSIFKALLKALHCRAKFVVKSPLKAPALGGWQN